MPSMRVKFDVHLGVEILQYLSVLCCTWSEGELVRDREIRKVKDSRFSLWVKPFLSVWNWLYWKRGPSVLPVLGKVTLWLTMLSFTTSSLKWRAMRVVGGARGGKKTSQLVERTVSSRRVLSVQKRSIKTVKIELYVRKGYKWSEEEEGGNGKRNKVGLIKASGRPSVCGVKAWERAKKVERWME